MNGRVYDPVLARFLSPDPYVQAPDFTQSYNRYAYCLNNPFKYTDPSGEFLTWSINNNGLSIGLNFSPIGIPLGFGVNIGWSGGGSAGVYGEVGYRVGGTGLGAGATVSQSLNYNFGDNGWSTTSSAGGYASFGLFNIGANGSYTYNMTSDQGNWGWGISGGINLGGDAISGMGLTVGYGSGGFTYGLGGYYNPYAKRAAQRAYAAEIAAIENINDIFNQARIDAMATFTEPGFIIPKETFIYPYDLEEVVVTGYTGRRGGFDIDKAVAALNANAKSKPIGYCARYVRYALEAGGLNTNGHPGSAKNYSNFLQRKGFSIVTIENGNFEKGDIAVFKDFQGKVIYHEHGHIQMYNGSQWVSDFRQRGFWAGNDYRTYKPEYLIFRWK